MRVIRIGERYSVATGEVETYDLLPVKTYVVMYNERDGFYLTEHPNIEVQEKVYGVHDNKVKKVIHAFEIFERSLGTILSGDKGIGKSIFAKMLCQNAVEKGYPVIIVDEAYKGVARFIERIEQESVVFFDEFDNTRIDMRVANKELRNVMGIDENEEVEKAIQYKLDKYVMKNQEIEYQAREMMRQFETKQNVQDMFHWYGKEAGDFRIGFDDGNGQWLGRKFSSLSQEDIDRILNYTPDTLSKLDEYRVNETKSRLADYAATTKKFGTSPLKGADAQDLTDIDNMLK